jgi:hypothetical protein
MLENRGRVSEARESYENLSSIPRGNNDCDRGGGAQSRRVPSGAPRVKSLKGIRRVDFQNFTYTARDEAVQVTRGRGTYRGRGGQVFSYQVAQVRVCYGDLTGDGKDDAAVVLYYTGGGTGAFSKGFLFTVRRGRLTLLTTFAGGDRADGGIREARIEGGLLWVQREEPERMKDIAVGLCCPRYLITTKYRWDGGRLMQVGEAHKVPVNQDPGFI